MEFSIFNFTKRCVYLLTYALSREMSVSIKRDIDISTSLDVTGTSLDVPGSLLDVTGTSLDEKG